MSMTHDQAIREADEAAALLGKYAGTEYHRALNQLLEALEMCHLHALADADAERMARHQGAIRQLRQLRAAATSGASARA